MQTTESSRHRVLGEAPPQIPHPDFHHADFSSSDFAETHEPSSLTYAMAETVIVPHLPEAVFVAGDPPKMTFKEIRAEVAANKRLTSRVLITTFRLAQRCNRSVIRRAITHSIHNVVSLLLRAELPPETAIGPGLKIERTFCLIVHPATRIGERCTLRHGVTLDARFDGDDQAPVIGNDVQFGAYCAAIGPVEISDNAHLPPLTQVHFTDRATSLAARAALHERAEYERN